MQPRTRALLLTALLVMGASATPVMADTVASTGSSFLGGFGRSALLLIGRLTEPGALLLWGTALAGVARVVGRWQ